MNKKSMIFAASLLMLASIAPVAAYHITAQPSQLAPYTSSDWVLDPAALLVIICESDGVNDPRNPNPAGGLHGTGGLCTSGRQDYYADGLANNVVLDGEELPPTSKANKTSNATASDDWTQLDVCHATLFARTLVGCDIATIGFTAEIGAYSCFVRTSNAAFPASLANPGLTPSDRSLYYREQYAWWSYDGNATAGEVGPGFHGHVAVFPGTINRSTSNPHLLDGSVFVDDVLGPGANPVNCGSSPVGGGPVVMADS